MGKQGPCCHCGVTSTPLWRNGPPEKPVLCNACGSRWRTKGSLVNYTPLHKRAEPDDFVDHRVSRVKTISLKNKETKLLKRKHNFGYELIGVGEHTPDYHHDFRKGLDEDTSNRSSSGSAISNSESCVQLGSADASELTGPVQSMVWDTMVPSKKRTCVKRSKQSSVEKLTKDLRTILHEQQSYFSGSSEEDLLFESDTPMVSVEFGHGSVLIRHPSSIVREEESEASSVSVDHKPHPMNEAYSHLSAIPVNNSSNGVNLPTQRIEKPNKPAWQGRIEEDQMKRDKSQDEKSEILGNHTSPLCSIDLKDIVSFEEFASHMTNDEQRQLLKYLPSVDVDELPHSLKSMFDCPQFKENLASFQKLLAEGVFDHSVKDEGSRTLKNLALCNTTKAEWVEQLHLLQETKCAYGTGELMVGGAHNTIASGHSANVKRSQDARHQTFTGTKTTPKNPNKVLMKAYYEKDFIDNDGTCFSPKRLFALPHDSSSLLLDSFRYADGCSDQDLLLDVPSHSSFPQAELLPARSFAAQASTSYGSIHQNLVRP